LLLRRRGRVQRLRFDPVTDSVAHPLVDGLRRPSVLARAIARPRHQLVGALIPDGIDGVARCGPGAETPARCRALVRERTRPTRRWSGRSGRRTSPDPFETG